MFQGYVGKFLDLSFFVGLSPTLFFLVPTVSYRSADQLSRTQILKKKTPSDRNVSDAKQSYLGSEFHTLPKQNFRVPRIHQNLGS